MLNRPQRIRLESDYKKILARGHRVYSQFFTLFINQQTDPTLQKSRFGFIASKKVGNAVTRNRTKRVIREIVRLKLAEIKPGFDVVLIISPKAVGQQYSVLETEVITSLKRGNLL